MIAGEKPGVQVEPCQHALGAKLDDALIVPTLTSAAGLPAIHPFSMIVVAVRKKNWRRIVEYAFGRAEEIVADLDDIGAEPRGGEIYTAEVKFRFVFGCSNGGRCIRHILVFLKEGFDTQKRDPVDLL